MLFFVHSVGFCVAVSLSSLLFHPDLSYLTITELEGVGGGWRKGEEKKKTTKKTVTHFLFLSTLKPQEIAPITFSSRVAPISTRSQL